jgi:cobalt/nickel transport system permease protein
VATASESVGVSSPAERVAPDWLIQPEMGLCPCGCIGKRKKGSFVTKTLNGTSALLRQALFAEDVATQDGLLQRLEVRVKVITVIGLLVVAALLHSIPVLALMYVGTLGLAAASRLSVLFFVKRVWLFIPIFTGIVVLPATLNVITPGHIVVPLGTWFGYELGITSEGLHAAGLIVIRVATSISLVVLLTVTTHLLGSVTDMYDARRARSVGDDRDVQSGRRFVAASAGALFGKAHALSEEVYLAMLSRGYTGNVRTLQRSHPRWIDAGWTVGCVVAAAVILRIDRVVG